MSQLKDAIIELADTTRLSNAEIALKLGCSRRHVRRVAGPEEERVTHKQATPAERTAKILLFDIETAPMELYAWSIWQKYFGPEAIKKDWSLLSWSAKWLFDPEIISEVVTPEEAHNRTDRSITEGLWKLIDEANIVVAHNGNKFDIRRMNYRFAKNGLKAPLPYRAIDTYLVSRQNFAASSYKLDYLTQDFELAGKMRHEGLGLWKRCVDGDDAEDALQEMVEYNQQDIRCLEDLYLILRPWVKSHPPISLYMDGNNVERCGRCGSTELEWKGKYYTPAGRFQSFRCLNPACGGVGRSRYSDLTPEEKQALLIATAK